MSRPDKPKRPPAKSQGRPNDPTKRSARENADAKPARAPAKNEHRARTDGIKPPPPKRTETPKTRSTESRAPRTPVVEKSEPLVRAAPTAFNKIAGLSAVAALFHHDHRRALRLYFDEGMKHEAGPFCAQMARMHKPYRLVSDEELTRIAGTVLHGGIVAAAEPREIIDLDPADAAAWAAAGEPLFILDGVGNPHNLGAIARTLAFFGHTRLIVSDHPAQASLSDAAYRVAEGGLEALTVYRLAHLPQSLKRLQTHYRVVGAALTPKAMPIGELPLDPRPLIVVLGNEEHGLPPQTLAACEVAATIPGSGVVQSLNVSASAAILIYAMKQH